MNLPLKFARRYLFAKRSTNAINIITSIAVFGVAVGAAALILVLSVFNGFEDLINGMFSAVNPDVRVTIAKGKTFEADSTMMANLKAIDGIEVIAQTLEEVAFFEYKDNQDFGVLKGVDEYYPLVTGIDSMVREGTFKLRENGRSLAVLGLGMRNNLNVSVDDLFTPISVHMPKRKVGLFETQLFRTRYAYPYGTFIVQQDFDNQYVITSLEFARDLLALPNVITALEIKLYPGFSTTTTFDAIKKVLGPDFDVKNRYQQEESFMKLMQMEKWLSYAIVSLMMLMVSFNIIGALWMIVLEKQKDIAILKSMGASENMVRNIFLSEGLLLCSMGLAVGFGFAILAYLLQKSYGVISIPGNVLVDAYPISMRSVDFAIVAVTVLFIGLLASIPPALKARRVQAIIRAE
jgi:lipoprotein-releasing system permease protein